MKETRTFQSRDLKFLHSGILSEVQSRGDLALNRTSRFVGESLQLDRGYVEDSSLDLQTPADLIENSLHKIAQIRSRRFGNSILGGTKRQVQK
jgi:hypothetical protein